jgi:hypothetical protein
MTPLFFPCAPGKSARYPFERTTLNFGESLLLSPQSLTRVSSCETVGVRDEVEYAAMLRQLLPYIGQALAEAFPVVRGKLEMALTGEFNVIPTREAASLHALEEALKFVLAVEAGNDDLVRYRHLGVFVAYCVAALVARCLARFESQNEPAWLALWFMGTQSVRAGFTSRARYSRYTEQFNAATVLERQLPLDVRLGLDGENMPLPTQRLRTPGEEADMAAIPWAGLLGAEIEPLSTYEAARLLETDIYAERIGSKNYALGRIGFQRVQLDELSDLPALLDNILERMGNSESLMTTLVSRTGRFSSSSNRLVSYGRIFHSWRYV